MIGKSFSASIPWIILTAGLIAFTLGTFVEFENPKWQQYVTGIGASILASGVFAVILKSIQFMGIFKDELTKIIFEPKFINNRSDLPQFWEKVTIELFKNKFPRINKKITEDVKNIYLPTTSVQYYDNVKHYIQISLIDEEKEIVHVIQKSKFTIIPVTPKSEFQHSFINYITCGENKEEVDFKLISFKVNEDDRKIACNNTYEGDCLVTSYDVTLSGKEAYNIEIEVSKQYSLKNDNVISQANIVMRNNFTVHFQLKGVKINFVELGTFNKFKTNTENSSLVIKEYQGIIYPKQGFLAIVNKI